LVGLVGLSVWLIACGGGERIPGAAVVVTGSGPTQVTGTRVAAGTTVQPGAQPNTFNIQGIGTVLSPVNLDANNDGILDTDVFVINAGSAPLGFAGFSTTDNAVVVVRIRARQTASVTVPINASGALQQNVALPPGDYEVTVENVTLSSGGNRLDIGEMAYAFSVFKDAAGNLHHTLPTAVSYRLPVVGQPVENVFLELTVDTAAAGAKGILEVDHANGEINLTTSVSTDGQVTFKAQPGGPTLGTVFFVGVGVLLP
jgi:hypothetical protein